MDDDFKPQIVLIAFVFLGSILGCLITILYYEVSKDNKILDKKEQYNMCVEAYEDKVTCYEKYYLEEQ